MGGVMNLDKLFQNGENAVVISMDHGYINGPTRGMINMPETIAKVVPEADAILLSPGMLSRLRPAFSYKGAPMSIVRLNWSPMFYGKWKHEECHFVQAFSPKSALLLGADLVLICLVLNTGDEALDARNVELFGRMAEEAREVGLPVVGEYLAPNFEELPEDELQDAIYRGARIAAEMGADLIKVPYTKDFRQVVEACPVPLLGLGGSRVDRVEQALQLAQDIVRDGGHGVVFGRNVLQREQPQQVQRALIDVVKGRSSVAQAMRAHGLEE